jgi:PLD-like domain
MKTCIQDPQWPDSTYLLEEILGACEGASSGVGVFAFASAAGVKLMLHDEEISSFLSNSPFELVVGMDAITDTEALDAILATVAKCTNLKPRVFLGSPPGSMFHPKTCWFRHSSGGVCLVGSGNLTAGGLRGNCEVFSVVTLTQTQLRRVDRMWNSWSRFHASELLPLDHPDVQKKASENAQQKRVWKKLQNDILVEGRHGRISVAPATTESAAVLIAEIPRGGSRWNQANFDLETFRGFFGASSGRTQRIMLTHVDIHGLTGPQEVRPSVAVKSHNYRFELDAAADLQYPPKRRPIAVFVRVATRTFRYRLLMPGIQGYREVSAYLAKHGSQQAHRVRRLLTNVRALRGAAFFRQLAD